MIPANSLLIEPDNKPTNPMKPTFQSKSRNPFLRLQPAFAFLAFAALSAATLHALTYTWDGTNNAPWSDAKWSDGTNSAINWVNGGGNDAAVNSGDVWSPIGISANSLTIGDGVGGASSASARFATNNAFWGITSITINSDGYLAGSANCTSHLLNVNLNGGTIGGGDNGGDAAFYGIIALHGPVNVNGGAVTSTINTTGGGVLLVGPTAGTATEFNVADGAAAVDLLVSGNLVHKPFGDSEKLLKTGAGTMVLSGTNSYQGDTTVSGGILSITTPFLFDSSTITIDSGAKMDLNFTGYDNVGSLVINGVPVANGIYNKDHPTYGSYFVATGAGSLVVGGGPSADGTWISTANGDWITTSNWSSATVANGPDKNAIFSAGTGSESITATLDSSRTIGSLAFSNANYTITGTSTLTLESSSTPTINVGTGLAATISSKLASTLEVAKTGAGTLKLYAGAGDNNDPGTYNHSLGGMDIQNGTVSLDSQFIKLGPINIASGATLTATQPWATGASNPWFNGRSAGPITVQAGGTLSTSNVGNGIMEGLTLLGGSVTAPGVSSGEWGAFAIASTITADGNSTSTISAELAIVNSPNFDVVSGSTLNITGVMHHRYGASASGILKSGEGLLILGGVNTFTGNTTIDGGTLQLSDNAQLKFEVSDGTSNTVTGGGTATFNGDFTIDTTAVTGTAGGIWTLVDRASLTGESFGTTFTVIGFDDPEDDGIWIMSDAKGAWSFDEGTGELTLDIGNDYDNWKTDNGVTGGDNDDDDSDGLTNHEEYAFGLDPTGGSSLNPITVPLNKSAKTFSYQRRDNDLTGLNYTVWYSTDLSTWAEDTGAAQPEGTPDGNGVETINVTLSALPGDPLPAKLFIQVRAN